MAIAHLVFYWFFGARLRQTSMSIMCQRCDEASDAALIEISRVTTHSGATLVFTMRAVLLASS